MVFGLIQSLGNPPRGLPVVSLCADSIDLFGHEQGILVPGAHFNPSDPQWTGNYYQTGKEWERCVNVEFYETDNSGINQEAGLRTHGGNGRRFQQKSLKIYAREEYGKKRFKHPFFGSLSIKSFKHLTLKPFKSSWTQAGLEDHLCGNLAQSFENVEALASRPVILFLNGEYWGIYYLHEKADERYLEDHFDIDLDLCDIVGNWVNNCEYGHADDFFETLDHLARADLNDPVEYHRIEETFDLDSFIDYQILELFFANLDWPSNNMRCWREQGGKWRWIFYDGDACFKSQSFDVFANATYTGSAIWPSRTRATLLFRRLLANDTFREKFFLRFKELLSTRFQYPATRDLLEEIQDQISSEIPAQANRFGIPQNKKTWLQDCEKIDKFLRDRTEELERQMEHFIQSETWAFGEWICYFDPGTDGLTLSFHTNQPGTAPLTVHDLTGRCLYAETRDIQSGFNSIHLQLSLKTGVYILTIGTHQQIICKY